MKDRLTAPKNANDGPARPRQGQLAKFTSLASDIRGTSSTTGIVFAPRHYGANFSIEKPGDNIRPPNIQSRRLPVQ
jgi:hypothetical protein